MIRSNIMLFDRQKRFEGDLNVIQQIAIAWLMNYDMEEKIEFEKYRALNTGLATNPATSRDFILKMLEEQQEEAHTDPEWTTPRSAEEIEQFLKANALY